MSSKSIWLKFNNSVHDPEQWIKNEYITLPSHDRKGNYVGYPYEKSTSKNHDYYVTQLTNDDCIYVFQVNKTHESLLTYKFILDSKYQDQFHGYQIKQVYKCLDIIRQFDWKDGSKKNGQGRWSGKSGKILKKCLHCTNWKLIKNFSENSNIDQELLSSNKANDLINKHKQIEGKLIKRTINAHSRSITLREAYLEKNGYKCQLCNRFYPKANGKEWIIDIHHLEPIANAEKERTINDLIGLCPNCHRFVHSIEKFDKLSWDQIREIFYKINEK